MGEVPDKDRLWTRLLGLPPHVLSTSALTRPALDEVAGILRLDPGDVLLDLACGRAGYGLELAARSGALLVGLDFAEPAIVQARANADRLGLAGRADLRVGDMTATGLPPASVNAVLCVDAAQFPADFRATFVEAHRVLRRGGLAVFTGGRRVTPMTRRRRSGSVGSISPPACGRRASRRWRCARARTGWPRSRSPGGPWWRCRPRTTRRCSLCRRRAGARSSAATSTAVSWPWAVEPEVQSRDVAEVLVTVPATGLGRPRGRRRAAPTVSRPLDVVVAPAQRSGVGEPATFSFVGDQPSDAVASAAVSPGGTSTPHDRPRGSPQGRSGSRRRRRAARRPYASMRTSGSPRGARGARTGRPRRAGGEVGVEALASVTVPGQPGPCDPTRQGVRRGARRPRRSRAASRGARAATRSPGVDEQVEALDVGRGPGSGELPVRWGRRRKRMP